MTESIITYHPTQRKPFVIGSWKESDQGRIVVDAKDGQHIHLVDPQGGECTCGGRGDCAHWAAVQELGDRVQYREHLARTRRGWKRCPGCGQVTLAVLTGGLVTAHACEICGWGRAVYVQPAQNGNGTHGRRARTAVRHVRSGR